MRRSTVIILILFLVAIGAYYYLQNRPQTEEPADDITAQEPTSEISYLFDATDGLPTSIRIEAKTGGTVEVSRDTENVWKLIQPDEAAADQGMAEAAASQVTTIRIQDRLSDIDLDILGLEAPEYVLFVKFTSGVERKVDIGVITPSGSGYYVRNEDGEILIASKDALDALLNMLTTPPYLETPTPSPTATETPVPSPTPEAAATETATPQP